MDEKIKDILDNYDIPVTSVVRGRGAWICITPKARYLLKSCPYSENHVIYEAMVKSLIAERGCPWIDTTIYNKEGQILTTAKDGTRYMLKQWFDGRECDLKSIEHMKFAVQNLAALHRLMKNMRFECEWLKYARHLPADTWMQKRAREMKMIDGYMHRKKKISPFEQMYIRHYPHFKVQAAEAVKMLEIAHYNQLYQTALEERTFCHGAYSHHNVLICKNHIVAVNFERAQMNVQVDDLYYFMRKALEKNEWQVTFGRQMLAAYEQVQPLSANEKCYLYGLFLFPEKFWKISNHYFNVRKSWMSGITMDKMQQVIAREDKRMLFLEALSQSL